MLVLSHVASPIHCSGSPQLNRANSEHRKRSASVDSTSSQVSNSFPSSGLFLAALMDKLGEVMAQSSYSALQVTALISRLAHYPQPLLRSYLLSDPLMLKSDVPSLDRVSKHHMFYGFFGLPLPVAHVGCKVLRD